MKSCLKAETVWTPVGACWSSWACVASSETKANFRQEKSSLCLSIWFFFQLCRRGKEVSMSVLQTGNTAQDLGPADEKNWCFSLDREQKIQFSVKKMRKWAEDFQQRRNISAFGSGWWALRETFNAWWWHETQQTLWVRHRAAQTPKWNVGCLTLRLSLPTKILCLRTCGVSIETETGCRRCWQVNCSTLLVGKLQANIFWRCFWAGDVWVHPTAFETEYKFQMSCISSAFIWGGKHRKSSGNSEPLHNNAPNRCNISPPQSRIVPLLKQTFIASINNPCVFFLCFLSCHQKPGRDNETEPRHGRLIFRVMCRKLGHPVSSSTCSLSGTTEQQTNCTLLFEFSSCEDATLMRAFTNPWTWCWSCCDRTEALEWCSLGQEE